ncbi:unnamed protein product [Arabidopsis halleri]
MYRLSFSNNGVQVFLGDLPPFDLASLPPKEQRNMIGSTLYYSVEEIEPRFAPKITGMILEMDQDKVLHLLESPEALKEVVKEAMEILADWIPQQMQLLGKEDACKFLASMLPAKL